MKEPPLEVERKELSSHHRSPTGGDFEHTLA